MKKGHLFISLVMLASLWLSGFTGAWQREDYAGAALYVAWLLFVVLLFIAGWTRRI